ncbi:MAG: 50S ribosomal protein L23, partial [Rickettsia endosymbiont of Labidopullus appendiculatus]|nr:50S ribosomal protein L23 [Rickettsia endosymbiont of Labidopullus appendiculatus]MCC8483327.1 50S ribosomal protein L23 [Rickettsia endosymbiont of Labidopullus appendiculatus]
MKRSCRCFRKEVEVKSYKHYDLIRNPVITEKSNILSEQNKF